MKKEVLVAVQEDGKKKEDKAISLDWNAANQEEETSPKIPIKESEPSNSEVPIDITKFIPVIPEKGQMAEKLRKASPYNFFLTTITANPDTHNEPLSITFQDLLDDSLGELESSVQFAFKVEFDWLYSNYCFAGKGDLPLLILYGYENPTLESISSIKPNITAIEVPINTTYGIHHSKIMLFGYRDQSMRIVISTANPQDEDWHNRVQGHWISDRLPLLTDGENGDSVTGFRQDFLRYLGTYGIPQLDPWIARIQKTDFRSIQVFFVGSANGSHQSDPDVGHPFGHPRLAQLLKQHSAEINGNCPIIAQSSAVGFFGTDPRKSYLLNEIVVSFGKDSSAGRIRKVPEIQMIYPSLKNVQESYDGLLGASCLPYKDEAHSRQLWFETHLYQWKSESRKRNRAMPHIKTYIRYNEEEGLYWCCLTSANLSKSAWGVYDWKENDGQKISINNYEAGVLFLPQVMVRLLFFF
jgi:tyrosyl-DNA phosphodiesterase-1